MVLTLEDLLGHFAFVLIVIGLLYIGKQNKWGFGLQAAGSAIWAALGWTTAVTSIFFWNLLFAVIGVLSFFKWHNDSKYNSQGE